MRRAVPLLLASVSCVPVTAREAEVADALTDMSRGDAAPAREHWREMLAFYAAREPRACLPDVGEVFEVPVGVVPSRRVAGALPHYDVFDGPIRYRIGATPGRYRVELTIAVDIEPGGRLELPDCALRARLEGEVVCEGTPYQAAPGRDACPESGRFEADATAHNIRTLLEHWSEQVEAYWNRDALRYDLPVHYDFTFFAPSLGQMGPPRVDVRMPLATSCARTPYFSALRSAWSLPIVAHEMGHFLGLLDEYEALSGVFYEKTPFAGSEGSRMGLSMKTDTRLFPFHHYLVLRWHHCAAPQGDAFRDVLLGP